MNKEQWWASLMTKMLAPPNIMNKRYTGRVDWSPFVARFVSAFEVYRAGSRPDPRTVVELKQAILCSPDRHRMCKRPLWDPWRRDNEESKGTS